MFSKNILIAAVLSALAMASPTPGENEIEARQTAGQRCVLYWQLGTPEGTATLSGCQTFTLGGTGRQTLAANSQGFPNCQIDIDTTPACRDFRIAGVRNCGNSRSFAFGAPGELRVCNP
ncbi:hypothetical protein MPH_03947 [Macrophomina phaseolina MS6]|uniref:Uncharacterized protein n=1 Tax=Macrophomina phaseolina (strain MS6) TaxID=1126212 RepID=K2S1D5_MACPH|nr:hypothetical protein MPH_03947 [Macrophomina phaseolina MS6]